MRAKAVHSTPTTRGIHDQHNALHTDMGAGGDRVGTNGAPGSKLTLKPSEACTASPNLVY